MYPRTRDLQPLGQLPAPPGGTHSTGTKGTHTSLKRSSQRVFEIMPANGNHRIL